MDNIRNNIKNYNKLFYNSGPVAFNDYIDNKYNIIHEKLYNDALNLYIQNNFRTKEYIADKKTIGLKEVDISKVLKDYKFIEIKADEYFKPSYVIQLKTNLNYSDLYNSYKEYENNNNLSKEEIDEIYNKYENQIKEIDLTPYWNTYQEKLNKNNNYYKLNINTETLNTAKIIYIDYIKGRIKLKSRYTDEEFEIDFKTYNKNLKLDDDMKLTNTFTNLRNKY